MSLSRPAEYLTEAERFANEATAANGDSGRDDGREEEMQNLRNKNRELQQSLTEMKGTMSQLNHSVSSFESRVKTVAWGPLDLPSTNPASDHHIW